MLTHRFELGNTKVTFIWRIRVISRIKTKLNGQYVGSKDENNWNIIR